MIAFNEWLLLQDLKTGKNVCLVMRAADTNKIYVSTGDESYRTAINLLASSKTAHIAIDEIEKGVYGTYDTEIDNSSSYIMDIIAETLSKITVVSGRGSTHLPIDDAIAYYSHYLGL